MKTVNNLFCKIVDEENILTAIHTASKGKRRKKIVRETLANDVKVAHELREMLVTGLWRPVGVHRVKVINDGISAKKRGIVCPHFVREQVVHHAIMAVCKPVFVRRMYYYSCASIPARGVEFATAAVRRMVRKDYKGTKYFVKLDIKQFFDSIRPSTVFHQLRRIIRDKRVLLLFAMILRANKVRVGEEVFKRGVPIGFYTSPWFANILLTPLDFSIKQMVNHYVRYNDDMLLFSSNKRKLAKAVAYIGEYLAKIHLRLKGTPQIHRLNNVPAGFIGANIFRDRVVLKPKPFLKAKRAVNRIAKKEKVSIYNARRVVCYGTRFKHYDCYRAFQRYIQAKIKRKRCRKIISRGDKRNGMEKK